MCKVIFRLKMRWLFINFDLIIVNFIGVVCARPFTSTKTVSCRATIKRSLMEITGPGQVQEESPEQWSKPTQPKTFLAGHGLCPPPSSTPAHKYAPHSSPHLCHVLIGMYSV